jgi:hypothetical protein
MQSAASGSWPFDLWGLLALLFLSLVPGNQFIKVITKRPVGAEAILIE